jgi:hypothetical protein
MTSNTAILSGLPTYIRWIHKTIDPTLATDAIVVLRFPWIDHALKKI